MMLNANKILQKVLDERDKKSCTFTASRRSLENFKKTCKKDGFNTYSPILEEVIKSFLSYVEDGKKVKISKVQSQDRMSFSFSCSAKLWKSFTALLHNLELDRSSVLDYLMNDYSRQRAKSHAKK